MNWIRTSQIVRLVALVSLVAALAFGASACGNDPEDDVDQKEQELEQNVDELEQDVRENTP